ncbi:MAG: DegT/DnrJ/EryC1/StrS aminotransferase family protein [Eubacterium sp.]|nr:DegT/DnrJ/EryC1/StrS aminotransferase family protein [Eubacterium sp.]
MNSEKRIIPFSPPDITDLEIEEVAKAMKSGWITTGPRTKKLESRLAEFCKTDKVVCLNSATASEELNLRVLGIGEGDEVILPAYTYTATASAVIHIGAKPIFIDSQKDCVEMNYEKVAAAVNEKTKAIIGVDIGGIVCDYDKIFNIAENKRSQFSPSSNIQEAMGRIAVLADCAHSLGASKGGKPAGSIADFSDFSFHAVKNFTTAEGGAATWRSINGIDSENLYKKYQLLSLHGQSKDAFAKTQLGSWEYDIVAPYYKCNMTDIMAAIGLIQLDRYSSLLARRKEIILKYDAMCDEIGVKHLNHYTENSSSSGHLYLSRIFYSNGKPIEDELRRKMIVELAEKGVATNVHYKPLPMMTAYKNLGWSIKDFPNAYDYYCNLITLPLHTKLTDDDVDYVCEAFKQTVLKYI